MTEPVLDQPVLELSPLAQRVKTIVDAVWKAQKFNRRLRIPRHELLQLLEDITKLEKSAAPKVEKKLPPVVGAPPAPAKKKDV